MIKRGKIHSMSGNILSNPIGLKRVRITDAFWKKEIELVRDTVIPYQWEALNDRVPDAQPSYCMHNFEVAGNINRKEEQYPDPELEAIADGAIDIVCKAQQPDGYLDTFYIINDMSKRFTNLRDHHELYCLGHLIEGAAAYYEATGKDQLLQASCRYEDCVADHIGPGKNQLQGYPGHEIAEMALARLYEVTGQEKYRDLGLYFIDERGKKPYYFDREEHPDPDTTEELRYHYHQAHLPVREQTEAVGQAVRAV